MGVRSLNGWFAGRMASEGRTASEGRLACSVWASIDWEGRLELRGCRRGSSSRLEGLLVLSSSGTGIGIGSSDEPAASWPMPGINKYL